MARTNPKFLCGLPSSGKLHNPEIRRLNRMENRAKQILLERKKQKAEKERVEQRDAIAKTDALVEVIEGRPTRRRGLFGRVKEMLQKTGLFVLAILAFGCAKHVPVGQPVSSPPNARAPYQYVKVGELYYVLASSEQGKLDAMREICTPKVICRAGDQEEFFVIEVSPK